jgi:hypothetical protein
MLKKSMHEQKVNKYIDLEFRGETCIGLYFVIVMNSSETGKSTRYIGTHY